MQTAGIVGPYRFNNFGDDLIGTVLARGLADAGFREIRMHNIRAENAAAAGAVVHDIRTVVLKSDFVVIGGGHILGDGGFSPHDYYHKLVCKTVAIRRLLGKRSVFCGVGAGPLQLRSSRNYARIAVKLCSAIGVRDEESRSFLVNELHCSAEKIHVAADLALLWPECLTLPRDSSATRPRRIGIQFDTPEDVFPVELAESLWRLAKNFDEVVFLSNNRETTSAKAALRIDGETANYTLLHPFLATLTACDLVVTTHLHLAIAAFAAGIPSATLAVNPKTHRFYKAIGRPERCLDFDRNGSVEYERFFKAADELEWTNEDEAVRVSLVEKCRSQIAAILKA